MMQAAYSSTINSNLHTQTMLFELLGQQHNRLYRFILRKVHHPDDASDLLQQTEIAAYQSLANFHGESKLSTWVYGVANNIVYNYFRSAKHNCYTLDDSEEKMAEIPSTDAEIDTQVNCKELLKAVQCQMAMLPVELGEAVEMVLIDGMSYEEVSQALNIPIGTVKSRVSRGRNLIKDGLTKAHVELF